MSELPTVCWSRWQLFGGALRNNPCLPCGLSARHYCDLETRELRVSLVRDSDGEPVGEAFL
ncbi:MAG: hypothetical protein KGK07_16385 [Chloroflexota bacterium]|nr:hypothetical protein [Chloroflexota bacterium]